MFIWFSSSTKLNVSDHLNLTLPLPSFPHFFIHFCPFSFMPSLVFLSLPILYFTHIIIIYIIMYNIALIKTAIGATIGGLVGVIMFRSGGGSRAACIATGVGVAAGSTYQRIAAKTKTTP
jgi:hypothetical protein